LVLASIDKYTMVHKDARGIGFRPVSVLPEADKATKQATKKIDRRQQ
jgi:hypothetical protein